MAGFVADDPDAVVFGTANGTSLASQNWSTMLHRACEAAGVEPIRGHWLRHGAAVLAAHHGATTAELMRRLGHASPAASMIYQHALDDRDEALARSIGESMSPRVAHGQGSQLVPDPLASGEKVV